MMSIRRARQLWSIPQSIHLPTPWLAAFQQSKTCVSVYIVECVCVCVYVCVLSMSKTFKVGTATKKEEEDKGQKRPNENTRSEHDLNDTECIHPERLSRWMKKKHKMRATQERQRSDKIVSVGESRYLCVCVCVCLLPCVCCCCCGCSVCRSSCKAVLWWIEWEGGLLSKASLPDQRERNVEYRIILRLLGHRINSIIHNNMTRTVEFSRWQDRPR